MLVLVSVTPMTRDQSLSLREDIACTDLKRLSMPNWQSYDQERLGYVYEKNGLMNLTSLDHILPITYSLDLSCLSI